MNAICGGCGQEIPDEPAACDPGQRKPCPVCASMARTKRAAAASTTGCAQGKASVTITRYATYFLELAGKLIPEAKYDLAVIVAHTACELATAYVFATAFGGKHIQALEELLFRHNSGRSLSDERVRKVYTALTGDAIAGRQQLWQRFTDMANLRNRIIHGGATATKEDAEKGLVLATELVAHLEAEAEKLK
jgi:hypothetical protein